MSVLGHVRYVSEPGDGPAVGTLELLQRVFTDPVALVLVIGGVAMLMGGLIALPHLRRWGAFRTTLHGAMHDYDGFVPWILRLSAGIALMGAGVTGYLFVPHVPIEPRGALALLFLAAGFMLLVGVAVRIAALIGLAVWGPALVLHGPEVLMAAETVVALVALTAVSAGRPSVDDILSNTLPAAPRGVRRLGKIRAVLGPEPDEDVSAAFLSWVPLVLRVGLGVSLLYAGFVEKILDPGPALATVEKYSLAVGPVTPEMWVVGAGLVEALLGLALIVGVSVRPVAATAFLVLTVTLFALPDDPVVAHVPLWGVASAVFVLGSGMWSFDKWRIGRQAVRHG